MNITNKTFLYHILSKQFYNLMNFPAIGLSLYSSAKVLFLGSNFNKFAEIIAAG